MKTKIANALLIFLLIICAIMLSFLAYRKFYPPKTVTKEKSVACTNLTPYPAVVNIQTESILLGLSDTSVAGTGTIIDSSGLILTNLHVVKDSQYVNVTIGSGVSFRARLIAVDPRNDIALLKVENPRFAFPVMPLMRPWNLQKEPIITVGSPFGLNGMAPVGILSGTDKSLLSGRKSLLAGYLLPESSSASEKTGGPLVNQAGNMIGMNIAVKQNSSGISFAIPLRRVENVLARYLLPERMLSMYFGFQPFIDARGVVRVARVFPGSPAFRAGLRRGMQIHSFQGWDPTHDLLELSRRMIRVKSGEPVSVNCGLIGEVSITPIPFSECPAPFPVFWKLGIFAETMDPKKSEQLRYPVQSGVIVTGIDRFSRNTFRPGDVIVGWNRKKIQNMEDLKMIVENAPIGSRAFVTVYSLVNDPEHGLSLVKHGYPVVIQ